MGSERAPSYRALTMSMICNFRLTTPEELAALEEDPEGIDDLLDEGADAETEDEPRFHDVDKAWHGLHFLLTGTAWGGEPPLNFIATGGEQVGEIDVGYGPARRFSAEQLTAIVRALDAISEDALRARYVPRKMADAEIYPDGWEPSDDDDVGLGYLLEHYASLKTFLAVGAARGLGLLVFIT